MARTQTIAARLKYVCAPALVVALLLVLSAASPALAVRQHDFKKCEDSSFCRRLRRLSDYTSAISNSTKTAFESPYSIGSPESSKDGSSLIFPVTSALHPNILFQLEARFHADGTSRIRLDQVGDRYKGWKRYDEAQMWAIENQPVPAAKGSMEWKHDDGVTVASFGPNKSYSLTLNHKPFKAVFARDGEPQIVLNERGLLHMEHFRPKPSPFPTPNDDALTIKSPEHVQHKLVFQNRKRSLEGAGHDKVADAWAGFETEDSGEWEESFSGKRDSKPKGPEAHSLDISFPGYTHVFGIPEHASPLNLRSTRGESAGDFNEPYRLMNTDVFEYEYDSPMSLYGSVPVMHAQRKGSAASVFWLSGSETWVDIVRRPAPGGKSSTLTHWFSESGVLDLFVYLSPNPATNIAQFTHMVGRTVLPQYFAIGYHQCRWNYLTTDDVLAVNQRFDDEDIPMDVIWLDIEYSKDHMYGVWDEDAFPKPERMLEELDKKGRKLVIIIDPHMKRTSNYFLYNEAQKKDVLVKSPDEKSEYEGWCWSGSASWLDMFHPDSWAWWAEQYSLKLGKIKANARNMHIWNDMNEPAIFNGPEITSPKDVKHYGGHEHRDLHNINSVLFQNATARGLVERESPSRRPFVLARAWWVGTQKYGATWTGDNLGTWEHLAVSVPMILANNIAGMSFTGADIGGFFGNPEPDMLVRWYQAGIFEPFFRAHAHIDTKRREPYLLEEPLRSAVRDLIKLRYKMLPAWYTAFKENAASGLPVLRPQYLMFPDDEQGFAVDDQYFIGDTGLLVKPAAKKDIDTVTVYLSEDEPYYNYFSHQVTWGSSKGRTVNVPAPLTEQLPLLHRGGSILPIRQRARRSAELGWRDPFTLIVALNTHRDPATEQHRATGVLYLDDGQTYAHEKGDFVWRRFEFVSAPGGDQKRHELRSSDEQAARIHKVARADPSSGDAVAADDTRALTSYNAASNPFAKSIQDVRVERLVILGLDAPPARVRVEPKSSALGEPSNEIEFEWIAGRAAKGKHGAKWERASELIVKDPKALITRNWTIVIESE